MAELLIEFDRNDKDLVRRLLVESGIVYEEINNDHLTGGEIVVGVIVPLTTMIVPLVIELVRSFKQKKDAARTNAKPTIVIQNIHINITDLSEAEITAQLKRYIDQNEHK